MPTFFPRDVLDEILDLIESVSEGFPTYSWSVGCLYTPMKKLANLNQLYFMVVFWFGTDSSQLLEI